MWLDFFTETALFLWYFIISSTVEILLLSSVWGMDLAARHCTNLEQSHDLLPKDCTCKTTLGACGSGRRNRTAGERDTCSPVFVMDLKLLLPKIGWLLAFRGLL